MMLIKWMSASSGADEWEVLSSHLQYLRCEISHITQWYLRATPLSERAHLENTNGIPAAPCFSSLTLSFTARHCEANWKALSLLRLVLKWAVLHNWVICTAALAYSRQNPSSQSLRLLSAPFLISDQVLWFRLTFSKGWICPESSAIKRLMQTWPWASHLVWVNNTSWMACLQSPQQGQKIY